MIQILKLEVYYDTERSSFRVVNTDELDNTHSQGGEYPVTPNPILLAARIMDGMRDLFDDAIRLQARGDDS